GPQRPFGVPISVSLSGDPPEPVCRRNPGMLYGLGNLIDNALDFARSKVDIRAHWDAETVSITVADDGAGFAPEVLLRL
ncbi:ATP-binding protein, partial [Thermoanaerobacterium sp. DL9XJH110]